MAKKISKTKKYDHVESSVKTGRTVKDVEILSKLINSIINQLFQTYNSYF